MDHTSLIILKTNLKPTYFRCGSLKLLVLLHSMHFSLQHCKIHVQTHESYSAVKKNASMAGNLLIIQTVFHIVYCGKVL